MKKYVITITFVNNQIINHTTANRYFAQHLMRMFINNDKVVDVQMKILWSKKAK